MSTVTATNRAYYREFGLAMFSYSIAVPGSLFLIRLAPTSPWRFPIALLPVIPALFALRAFIHFLSRIDEMQRRIHLEALAIGFGAAGALTFSYGFLENVGFPHLSYIYVWPLMIALWGLGVLFASRRYR